MINSQEIKIGTCIRLDGKIWTCIGIRKNCKEYKIIYQINNKL